MRVIVFNANFELASVFMFSMFFLNLNNFYLALFLSFSFSHLNLKATNNNKIRSQGGNYPFNKNNLIKKLTQSKPL